MTVRTRKLSRSRLGKHFNEGARLLWIAVQGQRSQAAARERIGCSVGRLTHWLYGDGRPSVEWTLVLQKLYGIPPEAWRQPPAVEFLPPAASADEGSDDLPAVHPTGTGGR